MSNEAKFTPGPWVADDISDFDGTTTITGGITGRKICQNDYSIEEDDHNINLIAAAPEMYEALRAMRDGEGLQPGQTIENILLKARGDV